MPVYKNQDNGTWYVSVYYKDWENNQSRKVKRGFKTKRDAQEWEREFLSKQAGDLSMNFETFVDIYKADMKDRIKEHTWIGKNAIIDKKILPYFKNKKINEIKPSDIRAWQNEMMAYRSPSDKAYSPTYLKSIHNQLSAIFNHAVRYYDLRNNPAAKAGNIGKKESDREMLFWTKEEYLKFADVMMDKPVSFYAFEMLYWCGLRLGEMLALTPSDFDFQKETVRINKSYQRFDCRDVITDPKTPKSKRTVKMPAFLAEEMQDYIHSIYGIEDDDRIFQITKSYMHHEMERGCKLADVKRIRIHDLRHPYVKHTTKIFSLRLMNFQAQAYPDARRKTRRACQLLRVDKAKALSVHSAIESDFHICYLNRKCLGFCMRSQCAYRGTPAPGRSATRPARWSACPH